MDGEKSSHNQNKMEELLQGYRVGFEYLPPEYLEQGFELF